MGVFLKYDIEFAKKQVADLEHFRIVRALSGASNEFQHIFKLVTLLLQVNHPRLPGFVVGTPVGISNFTLSDYQQKYLAKVVPEFSYSQINAFSHRTFDAIYGVYVMGSIASISQTAASDLDIWVCHREDLNNDERDLLKQKTLLLQSWAKQYEIDVNFFLMDQERFRCFRYSDAMTSENCGSAQYMLLLDEFYRSAIRLAGKPLLWLHLLVEDEQQYETEVGQLILNKQIDPQDWVDFGGLGAFSANEYFGASLWHLYKGIDSPYKSTIKILLLEAYSWEYPNTHLISSDFKFRLLTDSTEDYHFDPYLAMLDRVTSYLTYHNDFKRLNFVRRCFYIKATEDLWYTKAEGWRFCLLSEFTKQWGWDQDTIQELNQRPFWKIKMVKRSYNDLVQILMMSYRNLIKFARKNHVDATIMPQDISILSRKLYSAFEELPGKVSLVNLLISNDLSEENLTFIEVTKAKANIKPGWYVVNHAPKASELASYNRHIEYNPNLHKLVSWAYFNGLLTKGTQLHIFSQTVSLEKLKTFVADLTQFFPVKVPSATNEELHHQCEIRHLAVFVNLVSDPTKNLVQSWTNIQQGDLFSFGQNEESLVGSIDLIYRNLWNEIRTLHFEGSNAILLALKVLANKIHRGSNSPKAVDVFCYSENYQRALHDLVLTLVNKCIGIQMGTISSMNTPNMLRIAGKNWQFFFENRGMRWQEIPDSQLANMNKLTHTAKSDEKAPHFFPHKFLSPQHNRKYPVEIDAFASEGFLQFFFKDNTDGTFNVYILDEQNHLEIYRHCDGEKEHKIREINYIYQQADRSGNNMYHIIQRDFNYPQFYQLISDSNNSRKIIPFAAVH